MARGGGVLGSMIKIKRYGGGGGLLWCARMREPAVPDARLSVTYTATARGTGESEYTSRHARDRTAAAAIPPPRLATLRPVRQHARTRARSRVCRVAPLYTIGRRDVTVSQPSPPIQSLRLRLFVVVVCACLPCVWFFFFFLPRFVFTAVFRAPACVCVRVHVTVIFFCLRRLHVYCCACVFLNFHASCTCTQRGGPSAVRISSAFRTTTRERRRRYIIISYGFLPVRPPSSTTTTTYVPTPR